MSKQQELSEKYQELSEKHLSKILAIQGEAHKMKMEARYNLSRAIDADFPSRPYSPHVWHSLLEKSYVRVRISDRIFLNIHPAVKGGFYFITKVRTTGSGYRKIKHAELVEAVTGKPSCQPAELTMTQAIDGAKAVAAKIPMPKQKETVVLKPFREGFNGSQSDKIGPGAICSIYVPNTKIIKIGDFGAIEEVDYYNPDEFEKNVYFKLDCQGLLGATFNIIVDPDITGWMGVKRYGKQRISTTTTPKASVNLEEINEFDKAIISKAIEIFFT